MQDLRVAIVQADLAWEDKKTNFKNFNNIFDNYISGQNNIIILPEMFTTGFTMNPKKVAEKMESETMEWMHEKASEMQAVVTGSVIIVEGGKYFNRLIWMCPDGSYRYYDKRHLFTLAGEDKEFSAGNKHLIVEYKGWKIAPFICYDLRFPVWLRNSHDYHIVLIVANWPEKRIDQWEHMLYSRAIENQSYLLAANRIGEDYNKNTYNGNSMAISPIGKLLAKANEIETVLEVELSAEKLLKARQQMQFLNDRDEFEIKL